jgi:hypothetical protein
MVQWLVLIGLVGIPFAHLEHFVDQSFLKEYLAISLSLSIVFYVLYNKGLKFIGNKWLLFVIGSMIISTAFVPPSGLVLGIVNKGNFIFSTINIENLWNYKPILIGLIYLLMVCAIAYSDIDEKLVIKVISWVGFLMALVVIAQKFGFQQFWRVQNDGELGGMRHPELMGFMAQYTLVSAFMAICLPATLFIRKWWMSIIISIAIILTTSCFGIICIPISFLLYFCARYKRYFPIVLTTLILGLILCCYGLSEHNDGRFTVWVQIYKDMTHPLFNNRLAESQGFTGFGSGAFSVFFPILHKSAWGSAHNEFMEFMFNNGIFGLGMLFASITVFINSCYKLIGNQTIQFCLFSIFIIFILSNGTFLFHLGWGQFYTAVIVGLAYKIIIKQGDIYELES